MQNYAWGHWLMGMSKALAKTVRKRKNRKIDNYIYARNCLPPVDTPIALLRDYEHVKGLCPLLRVWED